MPVSGGRQTRGARNAGGRPSCSTGVPPVVLQTDTGGTPVLRGGRRRRRVEPAVGAGAGDALGAAPGAGVVLFLLDHLVQHRLGDPLVPLVPPDEVGD